MLTLGEVSERRGQNPLPSHPRCLVVCTSQPGVTFDSFDVVRFEREVVLPVRALLKQGSVDQVVLAVPCSRTCPGAERAESIMGEDGPPPHAMAPSDIWARRLMEEEFALGQIIPESVGVTSLEKFDEVAQKLVPGHSVHSGTCTLGTAIAL